MRVLSDESKRTKPETRKISGALKQRYLSWFLSLTIKPTTKMKIARQLFALFAMTLTSYFFALSISTLIISCNVPKSEFVEKSLKSIVTEVYEEDSVIVVLYTDLDGCTSEIVVDLELGQRKVYNIEINGKEYMLVYYTKEFTGDDTNSVSIGSEYWRI